MNECKIAEKLSYLRNEKGLTQEEVAQALNISNKTVSKWENGTSMPDITMLVQLAKYYNVSSDFLLDISENKKEDTLSVISNQFQGLERNEMILKSFEISRASIFGLFGLLDEFSLTEENPTCPQPIPLTNFNRSCIISKNFFNFTVNNNDVNASVMLLPNKSNFNWILHNDKQDKIIRLLHFLCDKEALKIC